jgi:hypothetical protein
MLGVVLGNLRWGKRNIENKIKIRKLRRSIIKRV